MRIRDESQRGSFWQFFWSAFECSEVFECFEEAFDEIAFGGECKVAFTFDRAILFWRDHRSAAAHTEAG